MRITDLNDITAYGIELHNKKVREAPATDEVNLCILWIKRFAYPRKTINTRTGSYGLKHRVEDVYDKYVSNGAFIRAALLLGYEVKQDGFNNPNAEFNMGFNQKLFKELMRAKGSNRIGGI